MAFLTLTWLTPARIVWIIAGVLGLAGFILFVIGGGNHSQRSDSGLLGMLFILIAGVMVFLGGLAHAVVS